jgi:hypothetical protein
MRSAVRFGARARTGSEIASGLAIGTAAVEASHVGDAAAALERSRWTNGISPLCWDALPESRQQHCIMCGV